MPRGGLVPLPITYSVATLHRPQRRFNFHTGMSESVLLFSYFKNASEIFEATVTSVLPSED